MVYQWKINKYPVSAQEAGERIEKLSEANGEVTPELLLEDSRPETALLHPCYEWDDEKAAEKYRLVQSSKLLGNLIVVKLSTPDGEAETEPVRAFVQINNRNEKGVFKPVQVALSDEETKQKVLANAEAELRYFTKKYKGLVDVAKLMQKILKEIA